MTSKQLYVRRTEAFRLPRDFDGDYQDRAAEKFRLATRWWFVVESESGIPEGFRKDMAKMPDAYCCVRAFYNWYAMIYDKSLPPSSHPSQSGRTA